MAANEERRRSVAQDDDDEEEIEVEEGGYCKYLSINCLIHHESYIVAVIGDIYIPPPPPPPDFSGEETGKRLVITYITNINFKSYAGRQKLGPFHKVRFIMSDDHVNIIVL